MTGPAKSGAVKASGPEAQLNALMPFVESLYPICRSITGDGVRQTLRQVTRYLPLDIVEVPTGTPAFDWIVPNEWNIRDAWIADSNGTRIVDFHASNLHVLNYSEAVDMEVDRDTLDQHLYSLPEYPDWIPYRTTYYASKWGFCLQHRLRQSLTGNRFHVRIDADLAPGHLTYGEILIPGGDEHEVLIYTHVCHPSLCNDNLSGIAVATAIGQRLLAMNHRRYSYRIVFAPGTIGSIVWLSRNPAAAKRIAHGLIVGLLGDKAAPTYKRTRHGDHEIDRVAEHVLTTRFPECRITEFSPYGYDERQFGSPGINLPVGRLTRSVNGGYPEYHTSADNLDLVSEERLQESLDLVTEIIFTLENNLYYKNIQPYCEPQLGRRGLYRDTGGTAIADRESAILWLLNQSDGGMTLLDIAKKSGINVRTLAKVAGELVDAELLTVLPGQGV